METPDMFFRHFPTIDLTFDGFGRPEPSKIVFGNRKDNLLQGGAGDDKLFGRAGDDVLADDAGDDLVFGGLGDDVFEAGAGHDRYNGGFGSDTVTFAGFDESVSVDLAAGTSVAEGDRKHLISIENVTGTGADDTLTGNGRDNVIEGGGGSDAIATGAGHDTIVFAGDPFDGADVSAPGRDIVGGEDFVADFAFDADRYAFDQSAFGVDGDIRFAAADANASGAAAALDGANVIVLLNPDNDGDPTTDFLAGTAANQIADLVSEDGAGFFVYFNSALEVNRLVYSENLNDAGADLKIVARQTDLTGQDAVDALVSYSADNFEFF